MIRNRRYEQGLDDYDEAVARVEKMKEEQRASESNTFESIVSMLSTAYDVYSKLSAESSRSDQVNDGTKREVNKIENNSTEVAEGRYIKGDPLKGYYDFIITEGSYKFWAIFQVNIFQTYPNC